MKHQALGRPTPQIMTMTHENAGLAAACGDTLVTGRRQPPRSTSRWAC